MWLKNILDLFNKNSNKLPPEYTPVTPVMQTLLSAALVGSERHNDVMGYLKNDPNVTPENLQRFFEDLARGVDYVYKRFGTTFDHINVIDDPGTLYTVRVRENGKIHLVITRSDIAEMCEFYNKDSAVMSPKTEPYQVSYREMVALWGVEEAYHQHQMRTAFEKYKSHFQPRQDKNRLRQGYAENLLEKDAEVIVRQAAREWGYFKASDQRKSQPKTSSLTS